MQLRYFLVQWVPGTPQVEDEEDGEEEKVMGDHAGPGGDEPHGKELGTNKGAHDADAPHADDVENEGLLGFANSHHHPLDDNGEAVEGLGYRHHTKDGGPQGDNGGALGEETHERRGQEEESAPRKDHQENLDGDEHTGHVRHALLVPGAVGIARQGGGGGLHAVARNVEGRFHRVGDGVGGSGHLAQRVDHGGEGHVTQGGAEALHHVGEGYLQTGLQDFHIRLDALPLGGYHGVIPKHQGDVDAPNGEGHGAGDGGSHHLQPGTGDGDLIGENGDGAGGIDE